MYRNHREDKFLRATNYKHYGSEGNTAKTAVTTNKPHKKFKAFSFVIAAALATAGLVIPTTTLAPAVDAFENSKAASYSVGSIDDFSIVITENCVPVTTAPATKAAVVTTEPETKAEEETKATEAETTKAEEETTKKAEKVTEASKAESKYEYTEESYTEVYEEVQESYYEESSQTDSSYSGSYLVSISNPDTSYSPKSVSLSSYDRAKLERLVMGEAGSMGYTGCALVAQSIRDAMNRSNTTSIDTIISSYQYYAPTNKEPNSDVKSAVSYIFDQNGSAVQHRVLCFYTGTSAWHETQNYITSCGSVRFFDLW